MSDESEIDIGKLSDREILILLARTVPGRLNDHGKRLRALEQVRNWAGGIGTGVAFLWAALKLNIKVDQS